MLSRKSYLAPALLLAVSAADATPPPPPTGELHIGRLGTACDGTYADGRPFRDYPLFAAPGQEYGLVIVSKEMDAALLVLESPSSKKALLALFGAKGRPVTGRFKASSGPPPEGGTHRYILRVQARSGQLGTFKVEVNYGGKAWETYHPGVDPAVLYAALNPETSAASAGCGRER